MKIGHLENLEKTDILVFIYNALSLQESVKYSQSAGANT